MRNYKKFAKRNYPAVVKRVNVYAPAVKQLANDVLYLKGLINSEPKSFNLTSSNNINYNGVVVSLCDIPQGDLASTRDGNRILPRYLNLKFHINRAVSGATATHTTMRFIIFRWWGESPNALGVAPTPSDILHSTLVGTQYAPLAQLNGEITGAKGDRARRIEVHRNGQITLDSVSKTSMDEEFNITLNGGNAPKEHMEYQSATTAPPTSGGFYILFINDNAVSTDSAYYLSSRITYYDN